MERKDKIKKLNELKKSIIALSLASTVVLSASACSNSDEPYFSETLSVEDYFESHDENNCYALNYIENAVVDKLTFEQWKEAYIAARSNAIYEQSTDKYKPADEASAKTMNRALYAMGLLTLKGQVIEALGINPNNIDDIKIVGATRENNNMVKVVYKTYTKEKATGNIDTWVVTNKNESYDLKGKGDDLVYTIVAASNNKISNSNDLRDYDEAYQEICEFMLCKGTPSDGLFSGKTIDFSFDPVKVVKFNEEHDPEHQATMVKTTETVK